MVDEVDELSTWIVRATFTDQDGNPVTPETAEARLDDARSGTPIRPWTALAALSTYKDIEITPAENAVINDNLEFEPRILTVKFTYATTKARRCEYRYKLMNLRFVS